MNAQQLEEFNSHFPYTVKPEDSTYRPYCLMCPTIERMNLIQRGFQCKNCLNKIGFDRYKLDWRKSRGY